MLRASILSLTLAISAPASAADVFERHSADLLHSAIAELKPVSQVTLQDASTLKTLSRRIHAPAVIIKTNDGNLAKAIIGWGFRKGAKNPIPVILLERFVTYRDDLSGVTTAVGQDRILFAGFRFNFDLGDVVPEGQGGDVELTADGTLRAIDNAKIFLLTKSRLPAEAQADGHDPNDHDGVLPRDFSGTWNVHVDGRWDGTWQLKVDEKRVAKGTFTSDETRSEYVMAGKVSITPNRLKLDIELANATMEADAWLWTKDKSAMAGTVKLAGRTFGFYALRIKDE